jgi:hypothetical protein
MLIVFHFENIEEYIAQLDYCSLSRMWKNDPLEKLWGKAQVSTVIRS